MKKDLAAMDGTTPVSNAKDLSSRSSSGHLSSSSCSIQASYLKLAAPPATPDLGRRKSRASVFNFAVGTTPQPPQPQPRGDGEAEGGDAEDAATLVEEVRGQGGGDAATGRSEVTAAEGDEKAAGGGGGGDSAPAQRKGSIGTRVRKMSREIVGFGGGAEMPPRGAAPQSLPPIEALRRSGAVGAGGALEAMSLTLGADCAAADHIGTQNPQKGGQDTEAPAGASDSSSPWARLRGARAAAPVRRLSHAEQYIEEVTSEAVVLPHVREWREPRRRGWPRLAALRLPAVIDGSSSSPLPGSPVPAPPTLASHPSSLTPHPSPLRRAQRLGHTRTRTTRALPLIPSAPPRASVPVPPSKHGSSGPSSWLSSRSRRPRDGRTRPPRTISTEGVLMR